MSSHIICPYFKQVRPKAVSVEANLRNGGPAERVTVTTVPFPEQDAFDPIVILQRRAPAVRPPR